MNHGPVIRPFSVARHRRKSSLLLPAASILGLGSGVFLWLADARAGMSETAETLPPLASAAVTDPAPLPVPPPPPGPAITAAAPPPSPPAVPVRPPAPALPTPERPAVERQASPLIFDLAQAEVPRSPVLGAPGMPPAAVSGEGAVAIPALPPAPASNAPRAGSENEQFSSRIVREEVEVARATRIADLDRLVIQGTIIAATMETALNSDLPGFARATVQRDVLSFDGSAVLIPAGSRVIGQYKSGVAQGASRIFIVWNRLIRPDGVSVSLGSPAIDELGRGGVAGKVNRHFLQRFGGSILLSVLTGGITAATAALSNGSTVVVGSAGQATALAQQAAEDLNIPPTITTRAGAAIRIFVARDLDFTAVGPAP
jgi:type IV secretion system protein VirB10